VQENHLPALVALIECKAEVNWPAKGRGNVTPLHAAAVEGNVEIIELLLSKKAKIGAKDDNGETPLFAAARSNCSEAVKCLVQHKANVDQKLPTNGLTAVWIAAMMGHHSSLATLIELDADTSIAPNEVNPPTLSGKGVAEACQIAGNIPSYEVVMRLETLKADMIQAKEQSQKCVKEATKAKIEESLETLKQRRCMLKQAYASYFVEMNTEPGQMKAAAQCWLEAQANGTLEVKEGPLGSNGSTESCESCEKPPEAKKID